MPSNSLVEHVRVVDVGYGEASKTLGRRADPSWYAYRGYRLSTGDEGGAGHLAWERVADRIATLRENSLRRNLGFNDRRIAYVMGYGLGLSDHGRISLAEAEAVIDTALPGLANTRPPVYRSTRFWLFVSMVFIFELSLVGAAEVEPTQYPVLSAPLLSVEEGPAPLSTTEAVASAIARVDVETATESALIRAAASGAAPIHDLVELLRTIPADQVQSLGGRLMARLGPDDRARLIEGIDALGGQGVNALLRDGLRDTSPAVIEAALGGLVVRGARSALPAIAGLLQHEDARVRRVAAEALGILAGPDNAWQLLEALKDSDNAVRVAARRGLTQIVGRDLGPHARSWWAHLRRHGK